MVAQSDASLKLLCLGSEYVEIYADAIARSELIQTLPSLPEDLPVPLSKREVSTWHRFSRTAALDATFTELLLALKVSIMSAERSDSCSVDCALCVPSQAFPCTLELVGRCYDYC